MSLFLQTLVPRGIFSSEQEHRQARIGVGTTLWPTGPTKGEEANEIEIGNCNTPQLSTHESGGRIVVSVTGRSMTVPLSFWPSKVPADTATTIPE